jgi:ribonucleotide reductase alpha subunit
MIKTIIKRNGQREVFKPEKLNGWGEWAASRLGHDVNWPEAVLHVASTMGVECTSEQLQKALIDFCLHKSTWEYNRMAGRLYAALTTKQLYGDKRPTVKQLHERLQEKGLMVKLNYSDEEYARVEKIINHKLDLKSAHFELQQIRTKYALRDKVGGGEFETPQFVYMRMAMALAENEPKETRMHDLEKWYEHLSSKRINVPTPYFTNLGTSHNGYASCCLYTTDDTAKSLAAGDHIAYMMTVMSAGIGSHIKTRSLKDKIRGGLIEHQGKLPYYRALVGAIGANLQNGRGGAATVHYTCFDPEVEVIAKAKNPMTPATKQVRGCDYSFGSNKFFARKVAKDEEIALFSYKQAPELYEAQYDKDQTRFEKLYAEYVASGKSRDMVSARKIALTALNEGYETGRHYLHFTDEMNRHTPFKDKIYSSNLCLVGETEVTIKVDGKILTTTLAQLNERFHAKTTLIEIKSYNTSTNKVEFKKVLASAITGFDKKVIQVIDGTFGFSITCTPEHKIYTKNNGYVEAKDLQEYDNLVISGDGTFVECSNKLEVRADINEYRDVFDITVEDNHNFFANDILVHNCQEIALPTKPFNSVEELYKPYEEGGGEIALCNIAGVVVSNIESDEQYAEVAYYALKMIDVGIHKSTYIFRNLEDTAKSRLNAGVGVLGLAHLMAKKGHKYSTQDGRNFIHETFETHAWHLYNASLRLGKEKGNAPWMNKTLFPEGWLPIDTYEKKVDQLVTVENKRDWESLRSKIVENGGIRNSVCVAHMPAESSSLSAGTTNGVYPIRDYDLIKTNDTMVLNYVVPDATKLRDKYEIVWSIDTQDLIKCYAVMQKWTDQAISVDLYRKLQGADRVGTAEMIEIYLSLVKYGIKTRYYQNSLTAKGISLDNTQQPVQEELQQEAPDDGICESCSL